MKKEMILMVTIAGLMISNVYGVNTNSIDNERRNVSVQKEEEIKIEKELYEGVPVTKKEKYLTRIGCIENIMSSKNILASDGFPYQIDTGFSDIEVMEYTLATQDVPNYDILRQLQSAKKRGIVTGYEDGTFLPNEMIAKEDMYLMMYRLMKSGIRDDTPAVPKSDITILDKFSDGSEVSDYAKEAVAVMLEMNLYGIEEGETKLDPKGNILVEDAKKVFEKFYEFYVPDASDSEKGTNKA